MPLDAAVLGPDICRLIKPLLTLLSGVTSVIPRLPTFILQLLIYLLCQLIVDNAFRPYVVGIAAIPSDSMLAWLTFRRVAKPCRLVDVKSALAPLNPE